MEAQLGKLHRFSASRRGGVPFGFRVRSSWVLVFFAIITARADLTPGPAATGALTRFEFVAPHMGTLFRLVFFAPDATEAQAAAAAAFARVAALNRILSDYDPDSEIMRLAREPAGTPIAVSAELFDLLQQSQQLAVKSGGAFDVTLGPVVRLWREARRTRRLPTEAERAAARRASGYEKLELHPAARTVTLLAPGMQLDLGGIAKGFAADQALAVLARHGMVHAMVAASGDLALGDPPPGTPGWRIEIAAGYPVDEPLILIAANAGVSTSGDTEQFMEIGGVRYSHIVNPATALGLTARVAVAAIAPSAALSDGWATACSVLSVVEAERMAGCLGESVRVLVLRRDEAGTVRREVHGSSPPGLRTPL